MTIDHDYIFSRFCKGDIEPFYEKMYSGLMLYAIKILGDEYSYMAEDCVQEAVMTTYSRRDEINDAQSWRSFIISCVRFNSIAVLRKSNRQRAMLDNMNRSETENDISYSMIEHELHEMLYSAIDSLPENYRRIFDMSFEQGLKIAEIAQMLDIAEITVKKRKARLLELLRQRLGGLLDEKTILLMLSTEAVSNV